jgi:hydrogenase maturation protease
MTKVLLLGIGNLLWADEGFGVRVIETLLKNYSFPENVNVLDGGTQGVYLVQHVQEADILVVFDAIDFGLPEGTLKAIYDDNVPNFLGSKKMSLHQTGFQEVLAMAQMLGDYPAHLLLIGVQPVELEDYGGSLRPQVKAQIQPAIELCKAYLQNFSVTLSPLDTPTELPDPILNMQRYETQRPSEELACRLGDERVISNPNIKISPPTTPDGAIAVPVDFRGQY